MQEAGATLTPHGLSEHTQRFNWCRDRMGFSRKALAELRTSGDLAEHENLSVGAPKEVLKPSAAEAAITTAARVFAVAGRHWLSVGQQATLAHLLRLRTIPPCHPSMLPSLEYAACRSHYDAPASQILDVLIRRYSRPHTPEEQRIASEVFYYAAIRATNQDPSAEPNGALAWIAYAKDLCVGRGDPARLAHLWKLEAIVNLRLGRVDAARTSLRHARELAGKDPALQNTLLNREALILARDGQRRRAIDLSRHVLAEVTHPEDLALVARRRQALGRVLTLDGQYDEAYELVTTGMRGHTGDHYTAQVDGLEALIYLLISTGRPRDRDDAVAHIAELATLASRLELRHHLKVVNDAKQAIARLR
ncbi:MAG: hypothetical protein A2W26_13620 [Acidobacteria bacterium RBG_16_64_8]|nr:MAG: hypothetical protein A2W26_13620 [Acidobacteria bacterium RBG_16_64_8]